VILPALSLAEVAAIVGAELAKAGVRACVVGGSSITVHAPEAYVSHDIDLAILTGIDRRTIEGVLRTIGYVRQGRSFVHPESQWTIDIVADTPYIASRPITTYASVATNFGPVCTYELEDAIADRIAAFLFWNDSQSLDVAERFVAKRARDIRWRKLTAALETLDSGDPSSAQRLSFAVRRLREVLERHGGTVG
jgi:hypothetical protein